MKFVLTSKTTNGTRVTFDKKIANHQYLPGKAGGELKVKIQEEKYTLRQFLLLMREIIQVAKTHQLSELVIDWKVLTQVTSAKKESEGLATLVAENMVMAGYQFLFYKTKNKDKNNEYISVNKVTFIVPEDHKKTLQKGIQEGVVRGTHINWCRNLANTPGNDMTPAILASEVKRAVLKEKSSKLRLKIFGEKDIRALKMGGVLAVGQGSREESKFIILEYKGGKASEKPLVLVGKGVTFDSGGIDTKPHPHALDMMMDMSGGAAVITTTLIAAKLQMKKNIIALVPAVENMPSGESFRPGDVITMLDGTTVEIGHTDAEGRLILADAIAYAKRYKPEIIIDVATLTGAAAVALGERATALFTNNEELAEKIIEAGENVGDRAWQLPLWEEFQAEIAGNVADISNVRTKGQGGVGGAITAATFVAHFAKDVKSFVHLDMAPTMTAVFNEHLAKGAKGSPVRLLIETLKTL